MSRMDDRRFGLAVRALRRRLHWRQRDLSSRARVRQQEVSDVERGHLDKVRVGTLRRITGALDARTAMDFQWRGGTLDRLVDHGHAELVERAAAVLTACGWRVRPEVSFAIFGERGSIDLLAWHEATRTALIIEVKAELTSVEETLRRFDVKERVAATVVRQTLGWEPVLIGRLLVFPETSTARRRVAEHARTFASRFPNHGRELRGWLRAPAGEFAAVWFLSGVPTVGTKKSATPPHRVRLPKAPPSASAER